MRAAVVGAGLSGLTAGYRLQQAGWDVTVFESEAVAGGRVQTARVDGYLIDTAATGLGESYRAYFALAAELGLDAAPGSPWFGIVRDGRIHLLRLDRMLRSGVATGLLSPRAKLRALRLALDVGRARVRGHLDYSDMRKAAPLDTESAAGYAARALDDELAAYLCEPVVRMMLIADAHDVSKVELFSGLANIFGSRIWALAGGQGRMPETLAERLDVRLGHAVQEVADASDHVVVDGEDFDACVLACPLPVAAAICADRAALLQPLDAAMGYTSCITVGIGTTVVPDSPAMLVELPPREDAEIALVFLDHNKAPDRAPAGHGLLGCCWEARASAEMFDAGDDAIVERTLTSVFRLFPELEGHVELTHVTRWARALPHTSIGAYRHIGEFNARLDPRSRIQFAADYMSAAGQNTAVEFGNRAAANLQQAYPAVRIAGSANERSNVRT